MSRENAMDRPGRECLSSFVGIALTTDAERVAPRRVSARTQKGSRTHLNSSIPMRTMEQRDKTAERVEAGDDQQVLCGQRIRVDDVSYGREAGVVRKALRCRPAGLE